MKAPLLLLLIAEVSGVYCSHSLQYYHTAVSVPGYGLPEYISVGFVDGIQITKYSSDIGRVVPVAQWMQKVAPDYWERNSKIGKVNEAVFKQDIIILRERFNQTGGFHSSQLMSGCELMDDGSTRTYQQSGYDGKDFVVLDTKRGVFIPLSNQAQISAQKWNSPDMRLGEKRKNQLENHCIEWLKKHLENGKEELYRRVPPEVKVSDHRFYGATKLLCQVYGFYPRDVDVNWKRDGIEVHSDEAKQVLPNTDGTYQITVTVEVRPEDTGNYTCHVEHISLDKTLIVEWEPKSKSVLKIAISVIAVLGVIGVTAAGFIIWKKRSGQNSIYVQANTFDKDGSPSSTLSPTNS